MVEINENIVNRELPIKIDMSMLNDKSILISAVEQYIKLYNYDLYKANNLENIFKLAKEDEILESKMFSLIKSFITI